MFLLPPGGSVTLNGTSPFQKPTIDTGFLDNDFDMYTLRYTFKQTRAFVEGTSPLKDILIARAGPQVGVETDEEIDAFHRDNVYVFVRPPFHYGRVKWLIKRGLYL